MTTTQTTPNNKNEFKAAAQTLFASLKTTKTAAEMKEISRTISDTYQLACEEEEEDRNHQRFNIWSNAWTELVATL